jgi:hypothetical protein
VYEIEGLPISKPVNARQSYFGVFVFKDVKDSLGVILSDTGRQEIDFFYGPKNEKGNLITISEVYSYYSSFNLEVNVKLNQELLPQTVTCTRGDSTVALEFKNYNLEAGTVDVQVTDTEGKIVYRKQKIDCREAIDKFLTAKSNFQSLRSLRINGTEKVQSDECYLLSSGLQTLSDGIGCLLGGVSLGVSFWTIPTLGPFGLLIAGINAYFLYQSCTSFYDRLPGLIDNKCVPVDKNDIESKLGVNVGCSQAFSDFIMKKPESILSTPSCVNAIIGALNKIFNEKINEPPTPIDNSIDRTVTAVSTSDPHLTTFDFSRFSFMAAGEFIAARSTTDNFEVQVRQQEIPAKSNDGTVSWNTGIAIRTGNGDVCIYPPNQVFVNRQNIGTNFTSFNLSGTGKIEQQGQSINITNTAGDVIRVNLFDTNLDYYITPATSRKGRLKGLLGNYDGQPTNDLQLQTGESVQNNYTSLYPKFSDSWRIRQSESLFVYDTGKNTEFYTDRTFPRKPLSFTAAQRAAARSVCEAAGVTDPILLENCIIDVASTNNRDNTLPARHYESQTSARVLNSFAIGGFSTSDVQLDYTNATAINNQATLDTRQNGFSRILMKQGVNIRKGFITEFSFSTAELHPTSCFYLALWPTEDRFRNEFQRRAGFCFAKMPEGYKTFYQNDNAGIILAEKIIPNFVDGKTHKVRIIETQSTSTNWKIELFLDDMTTPKLSVNSPTSLSQTIQARNDVGYIEFQINQGSPSVVNLFNWKFGAL